jgi:hypothetical protein
VSVTLITPLLDTVLVAILQSRALRIIHAELTRLVAAENKPRLLRVDWIFSFHSDSCNFVNGVFSSIRDKKINVHGDQPNR